MKRKVYSVRLSDNESAALTERNGNPGAGIKAAIDAYLATPGDGTPTDPPADPEIPSAAPIKTRKAKPQPPASAPRVSGTLPGVVQDWHDSHKAKPNPALCARCQRFGVPSCPACRTQAG